MKFHRNPPALSSTVAIPTYRRPDYLRRAATSVILQSYPPEALIIVARQDDMASREVISEIIDSYSGSIQIIEATVTEAGFLPPIIEAVNRATTDLIAFLDDDAEAPPDWLALLLKPYEDPKVGGSGGRYINYFQGVLQKYRPVRRAASLSWYGDLVGNLHCDCAFVETRDADVLIGGNMSFRRELLLTCLPDARLRKNVSFHWELDVAQKVKKRGFRLRFNPLCVVDHHSAPREVDGLRTVNYEGIYWSNHNYAFLMREHLSWFGFLVYFFKSFLLGSKASPGLAYFGYSMLRGKPLPLKIEVVASIKGRFAGAMA